MNILAIDTSIGETSVAVRHGEKLVSVRAPRDRALAERLPLVIRDALAESGLGFFDLDRIAVCTGPGGFSSIRGGVAAGRGIGLAAGKPVVGASGFRIMARSAARLTDAAFGLAIPAGQGAVFGQCFDGQAREMTGIEILTHQYAGAWFAERVQFIAGPGAPAVLAAVPRCVPVSLLVEGLVPDAATLADLAPELDPARDLPVPLYVRPADARPQDDAALPRREGV